MPNFVTPAGVVLAAVQVWVPRALRHRRKANRPAEILKAHHATKSRWSKTCQRTMDHGSSPRLYATRSRSMSSTSPPREKSSG